MNDVLLIVPTRSRPQKSIEFYESFATNSKITDLVFGLDNDDVEYPKINGVNYEINPRSMMNGTLNLIANKYASKYKYLAFMGDDHRIRTSEWDVKLVESISNIKNGIAYGNDLLQGPHLPTAVLMDSNIVLKLGFMAPPKQKHLYLDNFWKDLGLALGTLRYSGSVIVEHMHYSNNKNEQDEGYVEVNSSEMNDNDKKAFEDYKKDQFILDVEKLKS
jgi:hypothetical protein